MRSNTVFSQLLQIISQYRFKKCVDGFEGGKYTKQLNCWQQLIVLLFAQAKGLDSLRDIEVSLRSHYRKWYHLGLTSVARSTLADANNNRNSDIFRDDRKAGEEHVFLTNNFKLSSRTIADLYKSRWEVETFFKWIKQNLKIKSFLGTSKNAVMTQIWAAMIYYLLLSFIKFQTKCRHSLHELTRIVGELFLDNTHLIETLTITFDKYKLVKRKQLQLSLF